ncbi:hypothetical protein N0V95_008732 [Ascochyta clinopodiicola]|nr:hypothetical protein N0V95_008732 [Ascochyta clinopodiicola]
MFPPRLMFQRLTPTPRHPTHATSIDFGNMTLEEKSSLDLTQRIERKLAEYNASESIWKRWLFEITCWFISAASLGAIVGIYVRINNERLADWGTLLSFANVLGKFASAALIVPTTEALGQLKWNWFNDSPKAMWDFEIFDKATRGPWGAVMLLFRTKGRSLAALGALLIVLLLAIDTFLQQVVTLPNVWSLHETYGEVPRTVQYNADLGRVTSEGMALATEDKDIGLLARKYFYGNGTQPIPFGSGVRPDIPLSCPTNNCTWPVYETLGVCSECADVSSYLSYNCVDGRLDWTSNLFGSDFGMELTYPNATMCGYFFNSTNGDPAMMIGYAPEHNDSVPNEVLIMRTIPGLSIYERKPMFSNGSINFSHIRNPIADVLIVSAADGTVASVYNKEPPIAHECLLYWCVQTIKSSYYEGAYHEEILRTSTNTTPAESLWMVEQVEPKYLNGTIIDYTENVTIKTKESLDGKMTDFGLSNASAYAHMMPFDDMFPAFYTVKPNESEPILRYCTWTQGPAFNRPLDFNPWLAPNNITHHMERLATAMTNAYRSVGSSNEVVSGPAYFREVYIHVQWEWLIFPIILLLLSLVFLVTTIVKTSDGSTGIWKTSAMPTLIYGLPKEIQTQLNAAATWKHRNSRVKKLRVKLSPRVGWRISGQSFLRSSSVPPMRKNQPPPGWI